MKTQQSDSHHILIYPNKSSWFEILYTLGGRDTKFSDGRWPEIELADDTKKKRGP